MKTNCWLIFGTMLATTAVAQVNTNKLPEIPAPALTTAAAPAAPAPLPLMSASDTVTNVPAKKKTVKAKKKIVRKAKVAAKSAAATAEKKTLEATMPVTLVPGPATVAADHVNLRGQAGLQGEVVGHVQKGDTVNVLAEITLDKAKAGEPAQWAKIALPAGTKVWVDSKYIDATNNVVTARKLNLRGGPGENYSVLGIIEKGAAVTVVTNKNDWAQIQTPDSAFAFVAAGYLKQEGSMTGTNGAASPTVATTEPATTAIVPPTPTSVPEAQPIAPPAATPPPVPEPATATAPAPAPEATTTPQTNAAVSEASVMNLPPPTLATDNSTDSTTDTNLPPPPPRIVTHEGSVRPSVSLVAPTYFELYDPTDNKAINYLYSPTTNLNLSRYNGLHITVTGEEGMDVRWKDTPVLTIQKIYVLSAPKAKDGSSGAATAQ